MRSRAICARNAAVGGAPAQRRLSKGKSVILAHMIARHRCRFIRREGTPLPLVACHGRGMNGVDNRRIACPIRVRMNSQFNRARSDHNCMANRPCSFQLPGRVPCGKTPVDHSAIAPNTGISDTSRGCPTQLHRANGGDPDNQLGGNQKTRGNGSPPIFAPHRTSQFVWTFL